MKNQMFKTLGACFALLPALVNAQTDHTNKRVVFNNTDSHVLILKDTIVFMPDQQTKVLFIGNDLKKMVAYRKIDSLKTLLINDLEEARKNASFPADSKMTHYFVHPNGKRRLKAESEDYMEQEVNVDKEKQALDLDLPPYGYTIHDLSNNYEYQLYVRDPQQVSTLKHVNFNESMAMIAGDKKIQAKNFRLDIEKKEQGWGIKNKYGLKHQSSVLITPVTGLVLIGSKWSPQIGVDLFYMHSNKHARPGFKIGLGWAIYTFTELKDDKISDLTLINCYELKFLRNVSLKTTPKAKWGGISLGWLQDSTLDWTAGKSFQNPRPLNNAFKLGVLFEGIGPFNFSIDEIFAHGGLLYGVTFKLAF